MHRPPTSPCSVGFNAMAHPDTDIRYIKGIGETRANALNKLGIRTLEDLLSYFPRRWEDRTLERPIRELAVGEYACVRAMLAGDPTASRISGGRTLVKVRAVDDSGTLDVAFFNQDYRRTSLHKGETYIFYGKVEGDLLRRRMTNPVVEPEGRQLLTGRIMPIYPLAAGVSQTLLAKAMRQGLDACRDLLPDVLPDEVRRAYHLCYTGYAYENIHFPDSPEALDIARRALGSELDGKIILPLQFAMSRDAAVLRASHETAASAVRPFLDAGQDVAMLNLGDVSIYATFGYLQEILQAQGYATAMAAGVPSFCAAAARLNQPLTGGMDAPLTIAPGSRADEVLDAPGTKVLMKTGRQLPALLDTLDAHGALSRSALVCSCGLPDETIFPDLSTARPPQDGSKAGYFATVLVKE